MSIEIPLEENEVPNKVPAEVAVSVFMPAYQHCEYVRQAIESALAQKTSFPFEICIGEDESIDGTREICEELASKYPEKIRLFLRSRQDVVMIDGRPTGRYNSNRTRDACRGKYISICEGDDFWIDELKLQKQYDFMEAHPQIPICATRGIERTTGKAPRDRIVPAEFVPSYGQDWFLQRKTGMITASVFYRVDAVDRELLHDTEILTVDWAMMLGATEGNRRCAMLPDITAVYRKHGKGVWTGINSLAQLRARKKTLERYLVHAKDVDDSLVRQSLGVLALQMARTEKKQISRLAETLFFLRQLFSKSGRMFLKELVVARRNRRHST